MRAALFIVLLLTPTLGTTQQESVRCANGMCLVSAENLQRLVNAADQAEYWAKYCGWIKP